MLAMAAGLRRGTGVTVSAGERKRCTVVTMSVAEKTVSGRAIVSMNGVVDGQPLRRLVTLGSGLGCCGAGWLSSTGGVTICGQEDMI